MTETRSRKNFQDRLENMVRTIRDKILSGELGKGDYLPPERMLAKAFGMSNKSVRQGLDILASERLIEKIPRVGNKVVGSPAGGTVTLHFGYYASLSEQAAMESLMEQFQKLHPNIRVRPVPLPSSHSFKAVKPLLDEGALDVVTLNINDFADFVENGGTDDLETLDPNPRIYPFLTEAMKHRGELKVQPLIFSPLVLCYNKDHFRQKNLLEPDSGWRWSDLFEHAAILAVENERLGFYFHFPSSNRWPVFLLQSGTGLEWDDRGKTRIRGTQLIDSLRVCRELISIQTGFPLILSERDADAEELFFSGKVSMIMTSYFSLNHQPRKPKFRYDLSPLPYLNESRTLLLIIGLAVNRHSKAKDSARLLVEFLTSYRAQLVIRQKTLSIPSVKPAAEWSGKDTMYRPSRFHVYREIIPTFRVLSSLRMSMRQLALFHREARLYWSGLETEEAVAERLERLLSHSE